jgi:hypothetical protein
MKSLKYIISIALSLISLNLIGQSVYINTTVSSNGTTYKTTGTTYKSMIYIQNEKNTLINQQSNFKDEETIGSISMDFYESLVNIIKKTFFPERFTYLKTTEPAITLSFWVSGEGELLEVRFGLVSSTKITPTELALLETNLKRELFFNFTSRTYTKANFIRINTSVKLSKIN